MPMTFVGVRHTFGRPPNDLECVVTGEIVRPQRSNPEKVIYLLQLQFLSDNHREYLWGYRNGLADVGLAHDLNDISTPHLTAPAEDLEDIITEAHAKGWLSCRGFACRERARS